ncbi:hypothetical protein T12_13180 [Trichinella patagoniensis]|uniref:Uncharacterized protein n=1 Tax=Trichinella patagoniensis TaxID=990121 RepID=A0A0V0YWC7_9BILA|nr:hypothetical protein T12_981 [Trichinella patagoniensis]KRY04496.1 hypothetical protein T12_13180 [Trichinella patagoniensis]
MHQVRRFCIFCRIFTRKTEEVKKEKVKLDRANA